MIAFLAIIYSAVVVLVFYVLKVQPRPWPVVLTVATGVVLLGTVVVLWTLAAPVSKKAVVTRYVVQIVPYVKGQVVGQLAEPNVPLKKGDILYQVDPAPYEFTVHQLEAQLQAAKANVLQLEAGVRAAQANVDKAQANVTLSKASLDVALSIEQMNPDAIARLKLDQARSDYAVAQATLVEAQASQGQSQSAVAAAKENVLAVAAQLSTANFNLQECTVRAPSDGFVADWQVRPGTFVVPMPLAAVGTFIDTSETYIVASYPAQMLLHVAPDQEVELAFKSHPGQLFRGTVVDVVQASGEGQLTPTGKLPSAASVGSPGYLAVKIRLAANEPVDELALGTPGAVAIYTSWGRPLAMISKVAIRMQKWLYFLPLPS